MQTNRHGRSSCLRGVAAAAAILVVMGWPATVVAQGTPTRSADGTVAAPTAFFHEPRLLSEAISWLEGFDEGEDGPPNDGFYPELGHIITGAGWISIGPGYRTHAWGGRAAIDMSAALSWRAYKTAQGRIEFPRVGGDRLTIGSQVRWFDYTQVRYFGAGPDSLETAPTDYRVEATDLVTYASWRVRDSAQITGGIGLLSRPSLSSSTGPLDRDEPDTFLVFGSEPGATGRQPRYAHADAAITRDTRDHASYPRRGGLSRVAWAIYRDSGDGTRSFDRWELEAAQFVPIARERGVLAVHGWAVLTDTAADAAVPFYLLPSLGGHNTLRGFADYRFHDRHLLAVNVESRWALWPHVDAAVFVDAGNVAARIGDLDLARTSAGFGLRVHATRTTLARFDVGHSREGWRFILKLTDAIRLGRLARRTAALPFVP
jgi:hypothetical protein